MTTVEDIIRVDAPITTVFDAERNIDLHADTQKHRGEQAVDGVTTGLIDLGEEVEWEARHFGVRQRLRVRITQMERPNYFRDEMIRGVFKSFCHEHHFAAVSKETTEKRDVLTFEAPLGLFGSMAERWFLRSYMLRFLQRKNQAFKATVEARGEQESGAVAGKLRSTD